MGNEASQHLSSIGKCCSSEEIEEVVRRDGAQTLELENDNPTPTGKQSSTPSGPPVQNKNGTFNLREYSGLDTAMAVKI